MRKADIAEWLLSLATTPERAATLVGDLMQESSARGNAWFWTSVLRTTASMVWRAWADRPVLMMSLALGAFLLNCLIFIVSTVAIVEAGEAAVGLTRWLGFDMNPAIYIVPGATRFTAWGSLVLIGRWLARRAPGKEFAACLAFLCVDTLFWTSVVAFVKLFSPQTVDQTDMVMFPIANVLEGCFLLFGVEQIREQSEQAPPISQ